MDTDVKSVGVIGAGVMGSEVAQVFAQAGFDVVLVDVTADALDRARQTIERSLRFQRILSSRSGGSASMGTADRAAVLARIAFTTDLADVAGVDFVIENVTEDWDVKRPVFQALDGLCKPHVVFAVNTSVIPITKVGGVTRRPDKIVGAHFMNPVSLKPMVEVIRGFHTSDETIEAMLSLLAAIGKEGVVVADSPGFVSNRVLMLTVNEACYLVHEGVAEPAEIDRLFKGCFGHTMGPLETADLIGLDTILLSIEGLLENFGDSKYRPCPLLKQMVDAGLHGRKSGRGFYDYR
nr:3-hydroxyacyl-CoA dehydrogenase NAD-binding domain-containing protein [Microbispora rosea]